MKGGRRVSPCDDQTLEVSNEKPLSRPRGQKEICDHYSWIKIYIYVTLFLTIYVLILCKCYLFNQTCKFILQLFLNAEKIASYNVLITR